MGVEVLIAIVLGICVVASAIATAAALASSEEAADDDFSDRCVGSSSEPCPLEGEDEEPRLVSIAYLDGDDDTELAAGGVQFVNLPRDAKWVDGADVRNIDRLTAKPRIKVRFSKPGSHAFTVRHKPHADNTVYTAAEKGRNARFDAQGAEKSYTTEGDGTKIVTDDFFVAAAGKDRYQVEAEDDAGNTQASQAIETRRLIHVKEVKMTGLASAATNLNILRTEFAKHGMRLRILAPVEMEHMPNISTGDSDTFKNKARTAYTGSDAPSKEPYVVAIAYTDHLAVKRANQSVARSNVEVGPGKPAVNVRIRGPGLTSPAIADRYLWQEIVPGEGWFVSAKYRADGSTSDVNIPESKLTAASPDASTVEVDVTDLPAGRGTITLRVNWVDRMRAGLSFSGGNLICICTRAWWQDESTTAQNEVMVHELGHTVGMVADGTGGLPDAVPTLYDSSKGHVGNHCYNDRPDGQARYDSNEDHAGSKCVMYGSTNGKSAFCTQCAPAVRKLDLSAGWSRF